MFWEIYIKTVEVFVVVVTLHHIASYLEAWVTHKTKNQSTLNFQSPAAALKSLSLGLLAALRRGWKSLATFWDDVPAYKRVLDLLDEHKVRLFHAHDLLNWSSSRRIGVFSDKETVRRVLVSITWLNRFQSDLNVRIGTFNKPLGILMGDGLYWREARREVVAAFRETNLFNTAHVHSLYVPEINFMLEKLRRKSSSGNEGNYSLIALIENKIIHRMIYTQAMLLETLRLGSMVPTISLVNNKDCKVGGMGTCSGPAFVGCYRSKDYAEDPLVFQPERFISDDEKCITNDEKLLTFSYGPKACPGELIGRIGMFMFTLALLREFKWELSDEHPPPSMKCLRGLARAPAPYNVKISQRARAI